MRKVISFPAIFAFGCSLAAWGADWLNLRGDPQLTGWQKREKILTVANVPGLKLIWKLKVADHALATPVILGHWITNRGTKELVFAVSGSNGVFAVDADLGRLFWHRQLEAGATDFPVAPALGAGPVPPPGTDEMDDDDDVHQAVRPVWVLSTGGRLYDLHPTTGADLAPPAAFRVSSAGVVGLNLIENVVHALTAAAIRNHTVDMSAIRPALHDMISPAEPVLANGIVFVLAKGSKSAHAVLYGFDAKSGRQLYSSGDLVASFATVSGLAVANGHICFGTQDGTLYCFGFPVDL